MSTPHLPPRKVNLATVLGRYSSSWTSLQAREADLASILREACSQGPRPDLVIFPEGILTAGRPGSLQEHALALADVADVLARLASTCGSYLVVSLDLKEEGGIANAALLVTRRGEIAGIYRKVHPVAARTDTVLENGVKPGDSFPVFDCDFGRVGIQVCWDMSYEEGWSELARNGAELIAVPTASPQTIRPASYALRHRLYIVTSTPRDNVSVFNPMGMVEAQRTAPGVLSHTIDLSHVVLHWSPSLDEGRLLFSRYGQKVGGIYSSREDTGVFWSNDPKVAIGEMVRAVGLETMDEQIARCERLRRQSLSKI